MKANMGSIAPEMKQVVTQNHEPVLETRPVTAGAVVYPEGELMAIDADGGLIQYDPDAVDPEGGTNPAKKVRGVLTQAVDSSEETADGTILVHGTVKATNITVLGVAADADAIAALFAVGIFAQ